MDGGGGGGGGTPTNLLLKATTQLASWVSLLLWWLGTASKLLACLSHPTLWEAEKVPQRNIFEVLTFMKQRKKKPKQCQVAKGFLAGRKDLSGRIH